MRWAALFRDLNTYLTNDTDIQNDPFKNCRSIDMDNYMDYVAFLNDLNSVSSPLDYNPVEWIDMHPGFEARADSLS